LSMGKDTTVLSAKDLVGITLNNILNEYVRRQS